MRGQLFIYTDADCSSFQWKSVLGPRQRVSPGKSHLACAPITEPGVNLTPAWTPLWQPSVNRLFPQQRLDITYTNTTNKMWSPLCGDRYMDCVHIAVRAEWASHLYHAVKIGGKLYRGWTLWKRSREDNSCPVMLVTKSSNWAHRTGGTGTCTAIL
jgi:hypothetical protein